MLFGGNFEGLVFETELKIKISIVIHFIKMSKLQHVSAAQHTKLAQQIVCGCIVWLKINRQV